MRPSLTTLVQRLRGPKPAAEPVVPASARPVPEPALPAARYDKLGSGSVIAHLDRLAPKDLAKLGDHERTHQNRAEVVAEIDARLGREPWPGYDGLDVDGVRFGLDGAQPERFVTVLAYERTHLNRAGVILATQQDAHH